MNDAGMIAKLENIIVTRDATIAELRKEIEQLRTDLASDCLAEPRMLREKIADQQAMIEWLTAELATEKVRNPMNVGNLDVDEFYKEECDHPWHTNGGLVTECPQCHEAAEAGGAAIVGIDLNKVPQDKLLAAMSAYDQLMDASKTLDVKSEIIE